jgi:hypothetical protein
MGWKYGVDLGDIMKKETLKHQMLFGHFINFIPTGYGDYSWFNNLSPYKKLWVILREMMVIELMKLRPRVRLYAVYDKIFHTSKSKQVRKHLKVRVETDYGILIYTQDLLNCGEYANTNIITDIGGCRE